MEVTPKLFFPKVMHKRLFPKVNSFTYNMYYLAFPLSRIDELDIAKNKFSYLSFYEKDHGARDGSSIDKWVRGLLEENQIKFEGEVVLITLPRILGYVFNPVSFYFCLDENCLLRAVICEVNNTFGETHTYICAKENGEEIGSNDFLESKKLFHVSPFLEREGKYKFRFNYSPEKLGIWIDLYDKNGNKKLITSMVGKFEELNRNSLRKAFWSYPLITLKTIFLIHWQALKLVFRFIDIILKPVVAKNTPKTNDKIKLSSGLKTT